MTIVKYPQAEISNGLINARMYLPDSLNGFSQGTRFDYSGNIESLVYKGHNYFGKWFKVYDPKSHESVMGPSEEYAPLDYNETNPGGSFVKIGVGVLSKPDDKPYTFSRTYPVLNYGKWKVKKQADQIKFIHELKDPAYSYQYEKTVKLTKDKPEMVIIHTLKNTGKRTIETSGYNHNFFMLDKQPIGPGYTVKFPFKLNGEGTDFGVLAEMKGNEIGYLRNLVNNETVYCGALGGFGTGKEDYDIRIENSNAGAGVRITCDKPLMKLAFWCCTTTLCPEPYVKITVDPGQEFSWTITYNFYTLPEN
jgi:hypothetical protein